MANPCPHIPPRNLLHHQRNLQPPPPFQVERDAELLIETLQHYRAEGHYQLHTFVVMPDHLHLLLTPQETLERAVGLGQS
jgi:hypothetical protein